MSSESLAPVHPEQDRFVVARAIAETLRTVADDALAEANRAAESLGYAFLECGPEIKEVPNKITRLRQELAVKDAVAKARKDSFQIAGGYATGMFVAKPQESPAQ